jgi:DNA helicase-2/ATP-dependent DNA helicase PcrA
MPWSDNIEPNSPAYLIAASQNRSVRVVAGPGTGKSFAMKRRVARLLESGVSPREILPVTFTRVAAEDLHRELVGMGVPGCDQLSGTTLHSLSLRILMRNHVLAITGRVPRPLNIFELGPLEADLSQHGGLREVRKKITAYESAWARLQHEQPGFTADPDDVAFSRDLLSWMRFHNTMLIGEVIPQLYDYLSSNPAASEKSEFSHILVDEYQDLNRAEQGLIDLLSENSEVCIVGDDDQSIYSFKHAHPEGIREWVDHRPDADDLTLVECRRCPTRVTEMANSLISHNSTRIVDRQLLPRPENGEGDVQIIQYRTLSEEVEGVASKIHEMIESGVPPGDILVLAQRGVIGTPIYQRLMELGIPSKSYYAEAELDSEETQEQFAYLKLFVDRHDRVALRWLLGLGGSNWRAPTYARIRSYASEQGVEPWDVLQQLSSQTIQIPYTGRLVTRFEEISAIMRELELLPDLHSVIDRLFPQANSGFAGIRNLADKVIEEMENENRERFLSELVSAIAKPEIPSEVEDVRIMSLHKSKGLSSPVTIISGCVEGLLPKQPEQSLPAALQDAQIEEQRRLFFVGISRVKSSPEEEKPGTLILTYSQRMPVADAMGAGISPASTSRGTARLNASRFISNLGTRRPNPIAG